MESLFIFSQKKHLIYDCLQTLNAKNTMHYLLQLGQPCFSLKLLLNNILIKITVSGRVMHPKPKSHPKFDSGRKAKKIIPASIQSINCQNPAPRGSGSERRLNLIHCHPCINRTWMDPRRWRWRWAV